MVDPKINLSVYLLVTERNMLDCPFLEKDLSISIKDKDLW